MKKLKYLLLVAAVAVGLWVLRAPLSDALHSRQPPIEEKLYTALTNQQNGIFLAGHGLTETELKEVWSHTIYSHGDLFFVSDSYEYTMLQDLVLSVTPHYILTGDALKQRLSDYEAALEEILSTVDDNWTDLQKALYLHDYLCTHALYDETCTKYTAPDLLLGGTGVCQAYTYAYSALLNRLDIPCSYLISADKSHTWNILTLDGTQYHVDVTHDDPLCDRLGYASHKMFLVSDAARPQDHGLIEQEDMGKCTDSSYDSAFWRDATSAFVPLHDKFYFVKNGSIHVWDGQSVEQVFTIYSTWFTDQGDGSYWKGNYSALWACEDLLLYNTNYRIMALNPETGKTKTVYTYSGDGSIFGFTYIDNQLTLQIASGPNEQGEYITVSDFTV